MFFHSRACPLSWLISLLADGLAELLKNLHFSAKISESQRENAQLLVPDAQVNSIFEEEFLSYKNKYKCHDIPEKYVSEILQMLYFRTYKVNKIIIRSVCLISSLNF